MADQLSVSTNDVNQERWWQSGVAWGGAGGVVGSLGTLLTQVANHGDNFTAYDFPALLTALGTLSSAAYVLYRRFAPGLVPLFNRWG